MEKTRVTLNIAGQEFRLAGGESEEYMRRLAGDINGRINEIQQQYPQMSTTRCTLLAMLNMADELYKLRADYSELDKKISELREVRASEPVRASVPVKRPFERANTDKKPTGV